MCDLHSITMNQAAIAALFRVMKSVRRQSSFATRCITSSCRSMSALSFQAPSSKRSADLMPHFADEREFMLKL